VIEVNAVSVCNVWTQLASFYVILRQVSPCLNDKYYKDVPYGTVQYRTDGGKSNSKPC